MSVSLPGVVHRPAPESRAPVALPAPSAPLRLSWRLTAAAVFAVLALGLLLVRVDALPRTRPADLLAAGTVGRGPAAAAIGALVAGPAGGDPLAAVPADFAAVMRYAPVPTKLTDGTIRPGEPTGACSAVGGGTPFGFEPACRVHDYGYDLLRYAHATGETLTPEARRQLDAKLGRDLHARCHVTRQGLARLGCHALVEVFAAGVSVNSWRQRYGTPTDESLLGWALALGVPAVAASFLWRGARHRRGAVTGGHGPGRARSGGRLRELADATPAGRDRYVDFLRVASIATVVLGHWTITAVGRTADGLTAGNVLATAPWLWPATWVFQVMPVFFVVGGFSNMVSWQALERRGGGYVEYLSARTARLLRPALVFTAVWLVLPVVIVLAGAPAEQIRPVANLVGQPLWFLGVYLVVVALAPAMLRLHRRWRLWVPVALAAACAAVDALRFAGAEQLGYLNLLVVWALVQQFGFFYADGTLGRLPRGALVGLSAAGLAALVLLTGPGPYPSSMVGLPGDQSNMSPPTVCIVALAVWQLGLLMLARRRVSAWLARRRPWTAVIAVGSMAMTLYLWHITAMVALYGLVVATGGPLPAPGGGWWWATRPVWLALLAAALAPMALLLSRFERPDRSPRSPDGVRAHAAVETAGGRLAVGLGLVLAALGLLGFVASGFAPLLDPGGGFLLVLRVDPLQNMLHLLLGSYLAGSAGTGATAGPRPWLVTAAGAVLALATPAADEAAIALNAGVATLALAAAATRRRGAIPA